jgi:putative endonuclease
MEKFYVYVLFSRVYVRMYIGQTNNLERRLTDHNRGYNAATKRYIPWELLFYEEFSSREEAVHREKYWKRTDSRRKIRKW